MSTAAKHDVFISYARDDANFAQMVKGYLLGRGFSVWSEDELAVGEDLQQEVERAIDASDRFVLLLSPASIESPYVLLEAGMALARYEDRSGRVIPVLIGDVPPDRIPSLLRDRAIIDARGRDPRNALSSLDEALAA
jgi:hypothetical protein